MGSGCNAAGALAAPVREDGNAEAGAGGGDAVPAGSGQVVDPAGQGGWDPDQCSVRRGDGLQVHPVPPVVARVVRPPVTVRSHAAGVPSGRTCRASADRRAAVSPGAGPARWPEHAGTPTACTSGHLAGNDQHRGPLRQSMRDIEYGRIRNRRGPELKSCGRQTSRSAARGPRLLRHPAITRSVANSNKLTDLRTQRPKERPASAGKRQLPCFHAGRRTRRDGGLTCNYSG